MKGWQARGGASAYMDPSALHCQVCGKTIPVQAWVVEEEGTEQVFCEPDCERLYRDYWLPRYGPGTGKQK